MKVYRSTAKQNRREQERRQLEARGRQEIYDKLTPEEKLMRLGDHRAVKQRKKLEAEIGKR